MCGIFGYVQKQKVPSQRLVKGLKTLEYRGYDSWGIVVKQKDGFLTDKHVGQIGQAQTSLPSSALGLGHTRWATHGGVTQINAHPHLDCLGRFALVHNGIVENYEELKKSLIAKGHQFKSETDSETIIHLVEEYARQNSFSEAVRRAFRRLKGLNAIIVLSSKDDQIVAAKTGSPLVIGLGKKGNFIASDAIALLPYTRRVVFLEDGQVAILDQEKIKLVDLEGKRLKTKEQRIDWPIEEAVLGKYPHFMIKEISEQPQIIQNMIFNSEKQIKQLTKMIKKAFGTYFVGCGTAAYACFYGQYLFSRIGKKHINAAYGSEFGYQLDFLTPQSLVLALSQSGETIDIIESVGKAKKKGAKIGCLVNNLGSTLYRMSDFKMLLDAGPEKCVLATKSFTAKLAILLLLAYQLDGSLAKGKKALKKAVAAVEKLLQKSAQDKIKSLASKLARHENIYLVGRGQSYPIALEAALKIKEVSYLHAEGFAAGELKHGVIALIEKGTPCLVIAPQDETYGAVLSGAMEMKARGGYIIGISPANHEVFDAHLPVDDCGEATAIPNTVVAQLLAYYLALKLKRDPDKPRNLAKSVTVK
jgi:glucosamine--fructose-6-phosphate aminotransferase (isomerizing)